MYRMILKGFVQGLILTGRHKVTQKWPNELPQAQDQ